MERLNEHKKKIAITLALVALGVGLTYTYFTSGSRSTENAYINADVVSVAAQVRQNARQDNAEGSPPPNSC